MRQAEIYRKDVLAGILTEDGGEYRFCWSLIQRSFLTADMKEKYEQLVMLRLDRLHV